MAKTAKFGPAPKDWVLPAETQAQRIVGRLGGVTRLARLCASIGRPIARQTIEYWYYTRGVISPDYAPILQACAEALGVPLASDDWSPVPQPGLKMRYEMGLGWVYFRPTFEPTEVL